jgi:hypothetical protein
LFLFETKQIGWNLRFARSPQELAVSRDRKKTYLSAAPRLTEQCWSRMRVVAFVSGMYAFSGAARVQSVNELWEGIYPSAIAQRVRPMTPVLMASLLMSSFLMLSFLTVWFLTISFVISSSNFVPARRPRNSNAAALVPAEELLQPFALMASGRLAAAVKPGSITEVSGCVL